MKIIVAFAISLFFAITLTASERPNVLLIIADDQGIGDFGFMGNETVQTPNLDTLAKKSASFANFVVAPACSPTRASLMTGRNHLKTGVWGVGPRNNLMRDEMLMPHYFKKAGYSTGYFGKRDGLSHLELQPYDHCDVAESVWGYDHLDPRMFTKDGVKQREGWTCDLDVQNALNFMKSAQEPWWCTVSFILPHLPWEPDEKYAAIYKEKGLSDILANCYGSISQMDDAIGRLLAGLEKLGEVDNTIVVFLSDNGPTFKGMEEAAIANRNPLKLQGSKATVWENGILSPLLVRWPEKIQPGARPQFASVEDVLPTLLDLVGKKEVLASSPHEIDGISIKPALENPKASEQGRNVFRIAISGKGAAGGGHWVVNEPDQLPMAGQHVVLRGPRYKLHQFAEGTHALYDLHQDPSEEKDLSQAEPEIYSKMLKQLNQSYSDIIATGRAFRMPLPKVGIRSPGYNKFDAVMADKIHGGVRAVGFTGLRGFTGKSDAADYVAEVVKDTGYEVSIIGDNLDQAGDWEFMINGVSLKPTQTEPGKVEFSDVELRAGKLEATLASTSDVDSGKQVPLVKKIVILPKK